MRDQHENDEQNIIWTFNRVAIAGWIIVTIGVVGYQIWIRL